ncbi:hypothetical protein [Vallitalea sp.]|jgi:hypothetical protein|uniref:hypothetical protein n=1 Tax=Vallitalea sp. TaxID=1882829 RepID=UPI0025CD92D9|nr:hypothetical protein [Vallitalea sp.]MCT4687511.1 hypothetical protein [Vallitalea sp.]
MSNEALLSIVIGVILTVIGYFIVTKRNKLKISQKNKKGSNTISNSTFINDNNAPKK